MKKVRLTGDIIGLDLGKSRTGVARINTIARIAEPLEVIVMDNNFVTRVTEKIQESAATAVVVGLPRGLDGQITAQTNWSQSIVAELEKLLDVPVFTIDEAGTTVEAEKQARGGLSVDSIAAGLLLEDFLKEVTRGRVEKISL